MSTVFVKSSYNASELDSIHFINVQNAWDNYVGDGDIEIRIMDGSSYSLNMNSNNSIINSATSLVIRGNERFADNFPTITVSAISTIPGDFEINRIILDGQNTSPSFNSSIFNNFYVNRSVVRRYDNPLLSGVRFNANSVRCEYSIFHNNGVSNNPVFNITGTDGLSSIYTNHLVCRYCTFENNSGTSPLYANAHSGALPVDESSVLPVFTNCIINESSAIYSGWIVASAATFTNPSHEFVNCEFNLFDSADLPPVPYSVSNIQETGTTFRGTPGATANPSEWQLDTTSDAISFDKSIENVVTFDGSTDIITHSAPVSPRNGDIVTFSGGTLPSGIFENVQYYVINSGSPSDDDFQISNAQNGLAINFTGNGSGTIKMSIEVEVLPSSDISSLITDNIYVGAWNSQAIGSVMNNSPVVTTDSKIYMSTGSAYSPSVSAYDAEDGNISPVSTEPTEFDIGDFRYNALWDPAISVDTASAVTFNNLTNTISFTGTAPSDGNYIVFRNIGGSLPSELAEGVRYFVTNRSGSDFQISVSEEEAMTTSPVVIGFTDNGTGTSYAYSEPYYVLYTATDSRDSQSSVLQEIYSYPKAYLALNGASTTYVFQNETYVEPGASAIEGDGELYSLGAGDINNGSVDTGTIGSYAVTYTYTSKNGVTSDPITRTVEVVEVPPITLELNEDLLGNTSLTIPENHPYIEYGASADDPSLTSAIEITYPDSLLLPDGTNNPYYDSLWNLSSLVSEGSTYTIHYYLDYGTGVSITRTVAVAENQAPHIVLNWDANYNIGESSSTAISVSSATEYNDASAVTFDFDGIDAVEILPSAIDTSSNAIDVGDIEYLPGDLLAFGTTGTTPGGIYPVEFWDIDSISKSSGSLEITIATVLSNTISLSDEIVINDTENFNGKYTVTSVDSANQFKVQSDSLDLSATEGIGKIRKGNFYHVLSVENNGSIKISTDGSSEIDITSTGTGTHYISPVNEIQPSSIRDGATEVLEIDYSSTGTIYILEFIVVDAHDPSIITTADRYIEIVSNQSPTLKLDDRAVDIVAGDSASFDQLIGTVYDEEVSALDPEDGDVTDSISWQSKSAGYGYINNLSQSIQTLGATGIVEIEYNVIDSDITESDGIRSNTYTVNVNVVDDLSLSLVNDPDNYSESQSYSDKGINITGGFSGSKDTYIIVPSDANLPATLGSEINPYYNSRWDSSNLAPGTYTIYYVVVDSGGNQAEITRTVIVSEDQLPVWTLLGGKYIIFDAGYSFKDPGYTVIDDIDGDISDNVMSVYPSDKYYPASHPNAGSTNPYYDPSFDSTNLQQGNFSAAYSGFGYRYVILYYVYDPTFSKFTSERRDIFVKQSSDIVIELNGGSEIVYDISEVKPYIELGATAYSTNGIYTSDVLSNLIEMTIYDSEDITNPLMSRYLQKNITLGEFEIDSNIIDPTAVNTYKIKYTVTTPDGKTVTKYRIVAYTTGSLPNIRLL